MMLQKAKRSNMVRISRGKEVAWHTETGFSEKFFLAEDCVERFLATSKSGSMALDENGIVYAGESDLKGPYEIGRVNPDFFAAAFCLDGEAFYRTTSGESTISKGEFVVFPAFKPHLYWCVSEWKIIWFHLSAAKGPWPGVMDGSVLRSRFGNIDSLRSLMRVFMDEQAKSKVRYYRLLSVLAQSIAICIEREFRHDEPASRRRIRHLLDNAWIQVHNDFARDWTVEELAAIAGASVAQFHRWCRDIHATSPMRWVRHMRMNLAAELLSANSFSLAEIADKVGYENAFALSKAFKAEFGISPSGYRTDPPA